MEAENRLSIPDDGMAHTWYIIMHGVCIINTRLATSAHQGDHGQDLLNGILNDGLL